MAPRMWTFSGWACCAFSNLYSFGGNGQAGILLVLAMICCWAVSDILIALGVPRDKRP